MKYIKKAALLLVFMCAACLLFISTLASTAKTELGSVVLTEDTFEYTGEEIRPEFTVYDIYGNTVSPENYTCQYIGAVKAGNEKTKLYITANEDSAYKGALRKQFFITPVSIDKVEIAPIADHTYAASYIKPLPVLTYKGKSLTKGTDYTLTYENNKYAGTATIIITGSATANEDKTNKNFSGTRKVTFKINPLSIENYRIEPIDDKSYTGSAITPGIMLMNGEQRLSSARYNLSYKNNVNAGTATVIATGKGDYCGTLTATFKITPKQVTPKFTLSKTSYEYDGTEKKPSVKSVTYGEEGIAIPSSCYKVKYSKDRINAGTYNVVVTLSGNFSGSNTRSFVITPKSIKDAEITLAKRTYTYSGKACKPKVTVTMNGVTLKKDTDYKLVYSSNKDVGTGLVQIEGIGNYKNFSTKQPFVIRKQVQKFTAKPKAETVSVSYSKLKKETQKLPLSKTLVISGNIGKTTYDLGYISGGKFTINQENGTIAVGKGTPKGTYSLTLRICAEGDATHVSCYRLVDLKIKVK